MLLKVWDLEVLRFQHSNLSQVPVNHGFYAGSTFQLSHVFPGIFLFLSASLNWLSRL
jgi:hypothetical protein